MSLEGEGPEGDFLAGDFDLDFARSLPDVLTGLLSKLSSSKSWLIRALPRDGATVPHNEPVSTAPVDLSTDGHSNKPTDAEHILFPAGVSRPYSIDFSLPDKELWGHVQTDVGQVALISKGNELLLFHDWAERPLDVFVGPRGGKQVDFGIVAQFLTRGASLTRDFITIQVDDFSYRLDSLLQENLYLGTGGLEGAASIAGTPKPILIGQARQFLPVLVDGVNRIYQVHDGSFEALDAVEDSALPLVFGVDVADITLANPAPGKFDTSLATGFFKLGQDPSGILTCDGKGHNSSVKGYVNNISTILHLLATVFGGFDDPSELDLSSFAILEASDTEIMGAYFREEISIKEAMSVFHRSATSFGWLRPTKLMTVGRIPNPDGAVPTSTLVRERGEIRDSPFRLDTWEIAVGRVRIGYRPYSQILSDTDIDNSVSVEERQDRGEEYRFVQEGALIQGTSDITILTNLDNSADATALALRELSLRGNVRTLLTISPRAGIILTAMGDVFEITDSSLPVSPKKYVVVGVSNVAGSGDSADTVVLSLYG